MFGRRYITGGMLFVFLCASIQTSYALKSVYIISAQDNSEIQAYRIDANHVTLQGTTNIYVNGTIPGDGCSPVALAVWPQKSLIFITNDVTPVITFASSITLTKIGEFNSGIYVHTNDKPGLGGIAVDTGKEKIYAVERDSNNLYVYSWNSFSSTLVPDGNNPRHLANISSSGAYGIALDESNGRLYVTDNTKTIRYYSTTDWTYQGSFDIVVNEIQRPAVGIAVDPCRGYLYTGDFPDELGNTYLVRTKLSDHSSIEINLGYNVNVIGIDVDRATGLVYCTTQAYYDNLGDFRVYDSNLAQQDSKTGLGGEGEYGYSGPAGVAVGGYYLAPNFKVTETDNAGSYVLVNDVIDFNISYDANGLADSNVVILEHLPAEVNFVSASGGVVSGSYDANSRIVTWNLGTLASNASGSVHLTVAVNSQAQQGYSLTNIFEMIGDKFTGRAIRQICCLDNRVYVDISKSADGNGQSWSTAYKELRNAIINVRDGNCGCADDIWVAKGTYTPTDNASQTSATFAMVNDIDIFGHFFGDETSISQRRLADGNYASILSGDINGDGTGDVTKVVTAASARLDGFTVRKCNQRGIFCNACSPIIANCVVKDNNGASSYGIFCESGAHATLINTFVNNNTYGIYGNDAGTLIDIDHCTVGPDNGGNGALYIESCEANATESIFSGNKNDGIRTNDAYLTVERCDISDNGKYGIFCGYDTTANIQRCVIQNNSSYGLYSYDGAEVNAASNIFSDNTSYGVYISSTSGNCRLFSNLICRNNSYGINVARPVEIRNNTIVDNSRYGLYSSGSGKDSNIYSNIIYDNNLGSFNGTFDYNKVNYNCIKGSISGGTGNIIDQPPQFRDSDTNDYHLLGTSPCIDTGDPNFSSSTEKDIDSEDRVMDGDDDSISRVDMGADEFCPYDLSQDGFVNFLDFAVLANSWQESQGDANYNDYCDFQNNNIIDYNDLKIFCAHWLWPSDWDPNGGEACSPGRGAYFEDNSGQGESMMMQEFWSESMMFEESQEDQWESMLAGEGETAAIYLLCDVNEPNSGDEVTVQIYSDASLFCMEAIISVTGDANITGAVSTADCNEYGWDPTWPTDPYFWDDWVYVNGVKWEADAGGIIGYIKFRYNSGQVSVSITEDCIAYDANCEPALFSGEALIFGSDD